MSFTFGTELQVKKLGNGRVAIYGKDLTSDAAKALHKVFPGKIEKIAVDDKEIFAMVTTRGFDYEIRKHIKDNQAISLDWHNAEACRDFAMEYLTRTDRAFVFQTSQLRWEEKGEGKASPVAHEIAEQLSTEQNKADLVAWIEKRLA